MILEKLFVIVVYLIWLDESEAVFKRIDYLSLTCLPIIKTYVWF